MILVPHEKNFAFSRRHGLHRHGVRVGARKKDRLLGRSFAFLRCPQVCVLPRNLAALGSVFRQPPAMLEKPMMIMARIFEDGEASRTKCLVGFTACSSVGAGATDRDSSAATAAPAR